MSKQIIGAIDGDKLFEWMYSNGYFSLKSADMIADEWDKGTFRLDDQSESTGNEVLSGQLVDEVQLHAKTAAEKVVLRGEATRLREALIFYADPATYDIGHLDKHGYIIIDRDGGQKAREALSSSHREDGIQKVRDYINDLRINGREYDKDRQQLTGAMKVAQMLGITIPTE